MVYENVIKNPGEFNFEIMSLGEAKIDSPVKGRGFVQDDERVTFSSQVKNIEKMIAAGQKLPA